MSKWAEVGKQDVSRATVERLVELARSEEDKALAECRAARRASWHQWCTAQTDGGMRALFRWIREGPSSLQSTGIVVLPGGLYAGQKALLAASEAAWWPLWQNSQAPKWDRVLAPRRTACWQQVPVQGEELWWLCWSMAPSKAPGHDG